MDQLLDVADAGHIRAAIDVWPNEPLPPDHRARTSSNTILSSHRAGGMQSVYHRIGHMVADDIELIAAGQSPQHNQIADPEKVLLYRSKPIR